MKTTTIDKWQVTIDRSAVSGLFVAKALRDGIEISESAKTKKLVIEYITTAIELQNEYPWFKNK